MPTALSQLSTTSNVCRAAAISFIIHVLVVAVIKRIGTESQWFAPFNFLLCKRIDQIVGFTVNIGLTQVVHHPSSIKIERVKRQDTASTVMRPINGMWRSRASPSKSLLSACFLIRCIQPMSPYPVYERETSVVISSSSSSSSKVHCHVPLHSVACSCCCGGGGGGF